MDQSWPPQPPLPQPPSGPADEWPSVADGQSRSPGAHPPYLWAPRDDHPQGGAQPPATPWTGSPMASGQPWPDPGPGAAMPPWGDAPGSPSADRGAGAGTLGRAPHPGPMPPAGSWPVSPMMLKPVPHPFLNGYESIWWWRRVGAFAIDFTIWALFAITGVILTVANAPNSTYGDPGQPFLVTTGIVIMVVGLGLSVFNHGVLQGRTGWTADKKAAGMRLVSFATGRPVGVGPAMIRTLLRGGLIVAGNLFLPVHLLSWLWPLWDDKRQTWEDKSIDAVVLPADHAMLPPLP